MAKFNPTHIANLENETAVVAINANNDALSTLLDTFLSRGGLSPNQMFAPLDMNSNPIINLPAPTAQNSPVRLRDLEALGSTGSIVIGQGSCETIAALRALTAGEFQTVNVGGYYAVADGGGGNFTWSSSSTETDNGGTVIIPNSGGTGRWLRVVNHEYTPEMFGARRDGTNDRAYIQAAIDRLQAVGGGVLRFSNNTYSVSGRTTARSVLDWKNTVSFKGSGPLSEIKLMDNSNVAEAVFTATISGTTMTVSAKASGTITADMFLAHANLTAITQVVAQLTGTTGGVGTYTISSSYSLATPFVISGIQRFVDIFGSYGPSRLDNVSMTDLTVNYNGANNCASGTIWSFNEVICIDQCTNVSFDNCTFKNNSGSNTFVIGSYVASPTAFDIRISNCTFTNDGDRINAVSIDYSTLFIVGKNVEIVGNNFNLGPAKNGAAWELYGSNINVTGNNVQDYWGVSNVVAITDMVTANVNITGNNILDVNAGITLWTLASTSELRGINISGNVVRSSAVNAGGPYFVDGTSNINASSAIRNILIDGNVFQQFTNDTTRTSPGISLGRFYNAKVSNNVIWGVGGPGIYLEKALTGSSIDVSHNQLLNVGYCATAASQSGIKIVTGPSTASTCRIIGNTINPIAVYTLLKGIDCTQNATDGTIADNIIISATTPISNTGTGIVSLTRPASTGTLALLDSPNFTGTPTAPKGADDENTTRIATTSWYISQKSITTPVMDGVAAIGGSVKFAAADHVHPTDTSRAANVLTGYVSGAGTVASTDTVLQAIQKLNGNDGTNANLTGDVTSVGNATTLTNAPVIAKVLTGFVSGAGTISASDSILTAFNKADGNIALKAPLASPSLTGTPLTTTAAVDTNTTQIASTAFVLAQAASATPGAITNTAAVGTSTRFARADHVHAFESTAWSTYTPTISAGTGSPSVAGSATGRYKQIGKTVFAQIVITNSSNVSGASGTIKATLPVTAATNGYSGSVYESSITGKSGGSYITSGAPTLVQATQADATTWWVNSYVVNVNITYEAP